MLEGLGDSLSSQLLACLLIRSELALWKNPRIPTAMVPDGICGDAMETELLLVGCSLEGSFPDQQAHCYILSLFLQPSYKI